MVVGNGGDGLNLGAKQGDHSIAGVAGGLAQMARRFAVGLYAAYMIMLFVNRPESALTRGVVASAMILGLFAIRPAWLRVSAKFRIRRCYLYRDGLAVTDWFGRVHRAVAWSDVIEVRRTVALSLVMAFHRIEISPRGSAVVAFVVLGQKPALVEALLSQARRHGVLR
ncbi:hypothetical protein ABZ464_28695 [Streptomyces sp. NPDC005820]|uniref:hypothetical protein n=1 Tax=Streptomyces sp. NPDC005820 TaxID=3157069 RepID=UPI0033E01FDB